MLLFESLSTSKSHLKRGLFFVIEATLISLDIKMLIWEEMQVIDGLHRIIVFLFVKILSDVRASTNVEYQVQMLSIKPWPLIHESSYG